MKFLCKLFGCNDSKTVIKEVPVEVIKEVPVEVVKEVHTSVEQAYPQKPERPVLTGTPEEQLKQVYDHYGYKRPAEAYFEQLAEDITPELVDWTVELIDTINNKTMQYMNRPAFEEEVRPSLLTYESERATRVQMLQTKVEIRKDRNRTDYVVDALRNDLPICGCKVTEQ